VTPGDVDELAEALVRLLTDDELAASLAAIGPRRVAESLTWDHVAVRIAPVLETLPARTRP
jgi:glycosyltransferase involved in cell wall biosynthesis